MINPCVFHTERHARIYSRGLQRAFNSGAYNSLNHRCVPQRRVRPLETSCSLFTTAKYAKIYLSQISCNSGTIIDSGSLSARGKTNFRSKLRGWPNLCNSAETSFPGNNRNRFLFKTIAINTSYNGVNIIGRILRNRRVFSTLHDGQVGTNLSTVQARDIHNAPGSSVNALNGAKSRESIDATQVSLEKVKLIGKPIASNNQSASPSRKKDWYCPTCGNKNMRRWLICKHCSVPDDPADKSSDAPKDIHLQNIEKDAKEGRWQHALRSFTGADAEGQKVSTSAYAAVIVACGKAGKWNEAIELLNNVYHQNQTKLDAAVYNAVINACARASEVRAALDVLESMKNRGVYPDLKTYNAALNACATRGWWQSAVPLYDSMKMQGLQPSLITMNALMNSCRKGGNYSLGLEMFKSMSDDGLLRPNLACLNTAIRLCAQSEDSSKALELLESMPGRGLRPNIHTINAVVMACASEGRWESAMEILTSIPARGMKPNDTTITSVMLACSKGGEVAKALELFDSMHSQGILPTKATFEAAASACEVAGRPDRALELLNTCKKSGYKVSGRTLNAVLRACAAGSKWDDAMKLIDEAKMNGFKVENEDLLKNALDHRARRRTELRLLLKGPGTLPYTSQ